MLHLDWRRQLKHLMEDGEAAGPRGFMTSECLDERFQLDSRYNILDVPERGLNYRFMVAEWVWMMFGRADVESLAIFNSVMREFSDDGMWLTGAYGPHIKAQRADVRDKLRKDPNSRQAVIEILRPRKFTKDEPCTLSFQFLLRDGALNMIATMRSSDIWLGVPYDVFAFTQLLNCMAGELNVPRGWLSLRMGSSHLYDKHAEAAHAVLQADAGNTLKSPDLPGFPPQWLDDVLLKRDVSAIADISWNDPWLPYARILLSSTSDQALAILREL